MTWVLMLDTGFSDVYLTGDHCVPAEEVAIALAFDAFFTEVQYQIATGRLPYRVEEHSFEDFCYDIWTVRECVKCGGTKASILRHGRPCLAFHPRQP